MTVKVSEEIRNHLVEDYSKGIEVFLREFTGNKELAADIEVAIRGLLLLATNPKLQSHSGLLRTTFTPKMLNFLHTLSIYEFARAVRSLGMEPRNN